MNISFKTSIDLTSVQCDGAFELAVNASPAAQSKDLHQFSRDNIFKNQNLARMFSKLMLIDSVLVL